MTIKIIFLILFAIIFYKKTKHGLHMLQLESYKNERYLKWLKNNLSKTLNITYAKPKKAFVVTARIKRMYITYAILFIILAMLAIYTNTYIYIALIVALSLLAHFIVIIVNIINSPIEKGIQKSFIKKAKKKLEDMPNLAVIGITGSFRKNQHKIYCKHNPFTKIQCPNDARKLQYHHGSSAHNKRKLKPNTQRIRMRNGSKTNRRHKRNLRPSKTKTAAF